MGKRKSRAKLLPKKRMDKLDTVFCCPFCNHGSSVECRIHSEWIDECERVNNLEDDAALFAGRGSLKLPVLARGAELNCTCEI